MTKLYITNGFNFYVLYTYIYLSLNRKDRYLSPQDMQILATLVTEVPNITTIPPHAFNYGIIKIIFTSISVYRKVNTTHKTN